eukprot:scaffold620_cov169-Amphora_coffeaeformis.AAC.19
MLQKAHKGCHTRSRSNQNQRRGQGSGQAEIGRGFGENPYRRGRSIIRPGLGHTFQVLRRQTTDATFSYFLSVDLQRRCKIVYHGQGNRQGSGCRFRTRCDGVIPRYQGGQDPDQCRKGHGLQRRKVLEQIHNATTLLHNIALVQGFTRRRREPFQDASFGTRSGLLRQCVQNTFVGLL